MSSKQVLARLSFLCTICGNYKNVVFMIRCKYCHKPHCRTCANNVRIDELECNASAMGLVDCEDITIACYGCGVDICKDCSAKCYRYDCNMKYCDNCAAHILEDKVDCRGHPGNHNY